jgi:MoxR-like ATPase
LSRRFLCLATQNPIELEGTYPLPEAQLDRFLFNAVLDYLPAEDEVKVVDLTTTTTRAEANTVTTGEEILGFQQLVRMTPIAESVARYAVDLVRATRPNQPETPDFVKQYVNFGASVRAAQFLVLAGKARALDVWPVSRFLRRHSRVGCAGAAASRTVEFPCGIGAHRYRRNFAPFA